MAHSLRHPFQAAPYFSPRVWGTHSLAPWYSEPVPAAPGADPIGEVWLTGGQCVIESGPCAGMTLDEAAAACSADLLGVTDPACVDIQFPLLVKVLFPRQKLSVQVHPDDTIAQKHGETRGKTECWYCLDAEPGAELALGVVDGTTVDEIAKSIEAERLEHLLNWVPVHKGEMFYVDAGTIHAIGPGSVLLETQQACDVTYRMYDYGRPRELHLRKSFEAMRLKTRAGLVSPRMRDGAEVLVESEFFTVERLTRFDADVAAAHPGCLRMLFCESGAVDVASAGSETLHLRKGQLVIVPAACEGLTIAADLPAEVIRILPGPGPR